MSEETGRMSEEDKFLGVKHTIGAPVDVPEVVQAESVPEVEVEVVDDRPEEDRGPFDGDDGEGDLKKYSKNVQKRIQKATARFHEERRAKETAQRMSNEAVHYTQNLQTENQRLLRLIQDSQKALTEYSKYGADNALFVANENFKKAHESGDSEEIADAQRALTAAQMAQASAPQVSQKVIENWKQQVLADRRQQGQQMQGQQYAGEQAPEPDPRAVEWQEDNPWFGVDKEMTSFAYGVHEKLVRDEGIDPASDEYYELINKRMGEVFPSHTSGNSMDRGGAVVVETAPRRKAHPVVASAARNNGAIPRKVTLTSTQVSLAKRLGLTPQQYAQQLIKEMS